MSAAPAPSVSDIETHWAVDPPSGTTQFIAPVVRFKLHNKSGKAQTSVQATAVFRRKGEEGQTWGTAYEQVASVQIRSPPSSSRVALQHDAATSPLLSTSHAASASGTVMTLW
jgi:hypothetical protein